MAVIIQKIKYIRINDILPNPYQLRRRFEQAELFQLADSIKQIGMLSPIIIRRTKNGYELVCGQRRLRAASIAGLKEVPSIIIKAGDAQCAELSLIENIHRKNLSEYEEAEGYFNLVSYHRKKKEFLKTSLSKDSSYINDRIRILSLSEKVRQKLEENKIDIESAKEFLKIHDEEKQLELLEKNKKTPHKIKKKKKITVEPTKRMSVFVNTINKTVELLEKNGAEVEITQQDNEKYSEFILKIKKN